MNEEGDKQTRDAGRDIEADGDTGTDRDNRNSCWGDESLMLSDSLFLKPNSYSENRVKTVKKDSSYSKKTERIENKVP